MATKTNNEAPKAARFTVKELAEADVFKPYGYVVKALFPDTSKKYTVDQVRKAVSSFVKKEA